MIRLALTVLSILAACSSVVTAAGGPDLRSDIPQAHWIWLKGFEEKPETTIYFRKTLQLPPKPVAAVLLITADNHYKVWLNGRFLGETARGGKEGWTVLDRYDVAHRLWEGDNFLAVEAANHEGKGALLAQVVVQTSDRKTHHFSTDSTWEAASSPGRYWEQPRAAGGEWQSALDYGPAASTAPWFSPREPSELEAVIAQIKIPSKSEALGANSIKVDPSTTAGVSEFRSSGIKSPGAVVDAREPGQKAVFVCDFGKEVVGYPIVTGTGYGVCKISIACGEFEAECNAPFAVVLSADIPRGPIRWQSAERRAFRYLKVTVEPARMVRIERVQVQTIGYPVQDKGAFECSDETLNNIWRTSRQTLRLCMQEFYEDGVKRDRLLWLGDLRVEALVNYYTFGDTLLTKRSLLQMAASQLADGKIPGAGPDRIGPILPDYCAYFVMSLADYYRFTADAATVKLLYPSLTRLMSWFEANSDADGLFARGDREGWWMFIDWDSSLDKRDRVTAMEALYHKALLDAAELAAVVGAKTDQKTYADRAARLRQSTNRLLWNADKGAYIDCVTDSGPSTAVHKQPNALVILAGLPEDEMLESAVNAVANASKMPPVTTPYMNFYVAAALFENARAQAALDLLRDYWGGMLKLGVTTFWEKYDPNWPTPYEDAELSYCHGWSAGPGMLLPAYVAGVRPAAPGFARALIKPQMAGLEWVKATVPAQSSAIAVDWKQDRGCVVGSLTLPEGCSATLALPLPPDGTAYAVDGKTARHRIEGGCAVFELRGGQAYVVTLSETQRRGA